MTNELPSDPKAATKKIVVDMVADAPVGGLSTAGEPTLPESDARETPSAVAINAPPVLVVVWCPDEPFRVGEALMPAARRQRLLIGRGEARSGDPSPRGVFSRVEGGGIRVGLPLGIPRLSRLQATIEVLDDGTLAVENLGQCRLFHNGEERASARVAPSDFVQFGQQLLLLCTPRNRVVWGPSFPYPAHRFGVADAFGIVGETAAMWQLRRQLGFVAARDGHVLVRGESGTGKELVARAIHALSPRRERRMISRNAATIPEGLVDAELFGTARNYPNAGSPERGGIIGEAHGSTLFLDEFAELSTVLQSHLLRVLDAGEYQRLGDPLVRTSDFRLIAATNRPDGAIKEDVGARFAFNLRLPSLNDRLEDIPFLVLHLLRMMTRDDGALRERLFPEGDTSRVPRVSFAFMRELMSRKYRTNVRELEQILWASIEAMDKELEMPPGFDAPPAPRAGRADVPRAEGDIARESPGRADIEHAIASCNGNLELVWKKLGLRNRYVLRRLIAKHGIVVRRRAGKHDA